MIVYEITAAVSPELREKYEEYIRETHIGDLIATGEFMGASLGRSVDGTLQIRYLAETRDALDRYLKDHAPRLRKDAEEHFPKGVELTRKEWDVFATYGVTFGAV